MVEISYEKLTNELDGYSTAVSKGVRTAAFGTIAAIWAVATADGIALDETGLFGVSTDCLVRASFILAGAALLVDLLQYIAAYWMTSIGIDKWEKREASGKEVKFSYDKTNLGRNGLLLYRLSFVLFPLKLGLSVLAATAFFFFTFAVTLPKSG